jgi:hypothetical protein
MTNEPCGVSIDELKYDEDFMSREKLQEEYECRAENMIGDFDNFSDLIAAWINADVELLKDIAMKIRMRDPSVAGILPMLKAEYVRQLWRNEE